MYPEYNYFPPQEPYIERAAQAIREFFARRKTPFHFRQLQVLFETQFFHITIAQAIYRLMDEGYLKTLSRQAGANEATFVFPAHLLDSEKTRSILMTHINSKAKAIAIFDNSIVSKDLGDHFEGLVKYELKSHGLNIISTNSNTYKGRSWTKSRANLDFIAEHPNKTAFGVQAKNELKSIEKPELLEQMEICSHLRVKPLFIVRYMPFSFTPLIKQQDGFLSVIGNQLWPFGYRQKCEIVKKKLSTPMPEGVKILAPKVRSQWPIEVRADIPEDASKRLNYWITTGKYPE